MTQQELADATGLSLGALRHLEQGLRGPTWDSVVRLCRVLNVTSEVFMPPKDEATTHEPPPAKGRPKGKPEHP